jgi:metallo-beta-lactamase class B
VLPFLPRLAAAVFFTLSAIAPALAGGPLTIPDRWTQPAKPFRIVGNVYYVGTKGLAAYLIVDEDAGVILLDGTMPENAPLIEKNVAALGYKLGDIKIILNSHAHLDHAGAIAELKRDSGAKFYASAGDRPALERGRHEGDTTYAQAVFPAVKVDRTIANGETVALGGTRLTATLTPGHTKGCTTWSMTAMEDGRELAVIFPCSLGGGGNVLVGNKAYPDIVADYQASIAAMAGMKADVVLPAHPEAAGVLERAARRDAGEKDAFVDKALLQAIVAKSKAALEKDLAKQTKRKK